MAPIFQGEEKSLTEDILFKKRPNFIPTESEWAARNREQIFRSGLLVGGGTESVMFTVPENKTLFITSASLGAASDGSFSAPNSAAIIRIVIGRSTKPILVAFLWSGITDAISNALNYTMPIKVEAGDRVILSGTETSSVARHANFTGWLESKLIAG